MATEEGGVRKESNHDKIAQLARFDESLLLGDVFLDGCLFDRCSESSNEHCR